jgi:dihydropyrimidinase
MSELTTVLRGVDAVLPGGRRTADIGIGSDGTIAAIGDAGSLSARQVRDAAGLVAIPGGVDLHVHLDTYFGGTTTRDDFTTGTRAALFGGTTTIAQFAIPRPGETTLDAAERTEVEARDAALSDYAVHGSTVRERYEESVAQLPELPARGIGTVKIFAAYTDVIGLTPDQIERLLGVAARSGLTVFIHAETDDDVRAGIAHEVDLGETGPVGHARSRTPAAETSSVGANAELARRTGARVYFVHMSSAGSIAELAARRARGERLFAETCPHYLFLDEALYARSDGAKWICSPPIRDAANRDALWRGVLDGTLDAVSSDHNCFDVDQKGPVGTDFRKVPNGLPGIEFRVPLLVGAAIEGRLPWERLVQVSSEGPAKVLGLWPRKGALAAGSDADIVLIDPGASTDLGTSHMATDYSPYAGQSSRGRIVSVYRRGDLVVDGANLDARPGSGHRLTVRPN